MNERCQHPIYVFLLCEKPYTNVYVFTGESGNSFTTLRCLEHIIDVNDYSEAHWLKQRPYEISVDEYICMNVLHE